MQALATFFPCEVIFHSLLTLLAMQSLFTLIIIYYRYGILQPACVARKIKLPQIQNLDPKIKSICTRFKSHHLESCRNDIVTDLRYVVH